jgi:hypothetical protein
VKKDKRNRSSERYDPVSDCPQGVSASAQPGGQPIIHAANLSFSAGHEGGVHSRNSLPVSPATQLSKYSISSAGVCPVPGELAAELGEGDGSPGGEEGASLFGGHWVDWEVRSCGK